jgi:hypothetical protein
MTIRREIIWEPETATDAEVRQKEVEHRASIERSHDRLQKVATV